MKINMTQQEIKDCLHALDTAESILSNISEQVPKRCPTLKEQSKGGKYHKQFAKIRVGGGQRWWRKTASMMQVLRGQLAPHHTSERHKRVLLKPKLGLGEGFSIEIDKGVAPLVKELWKNKIRTYECCQGGYDGEIGSENDRGWIILHAEDFIKAKKILTKYVGRWVMEFGTGGYCPEEYNKSVTKNDTFVYVSWKSK